MLSTEERDLGAWEAGVSDLDGVATLERREVGLPFHFIYFFILLHFEACRIVVP